MLDDERLNNAPMQRQAAIDSFSRELILAEQAYLEFLDNRGVLTHAQAIGKTSPGSKAISQRLQPGEALLEYVLAREQLLVFLVRSDGLRTLTYPVSRRALDSRTGLLRGPGAATRKTGIGAIPRAASRTP